MQLLSRKEMEGSLGIYIHIPFCASKCPYCDFNSISIDGGDGPLRPTLSPELEERYVSALLAEFAERLGADVETIDLTSTAGSEAEKLNDLFPSS